MCDIMDFRRICEQMRPERFTRGVWLLFGAVLNQLEAVLRALKVERDFSFGLDRLYLTAKPEDAFLTPEEIVALTAYNNPDATYVGLVETINHMTIEDIK